ncbi:response regulator [Sulfurimonas sp.]|nr:response regulator [Sulfurimonas sp.]
MSSVKLLASTGKDFKVLYIEDDIEIRNSTSQFLNTFFNVVDTAIDGLDGLEKYKSFHKENNSYYHLIITDINMPNMNGIELSKNILKINPDQTILVISAYNDSNNLIEMINLHISHFTPKPILQEHIIETLLMICNRLNDTILLDRYYLDIEKLSNELCDKNKQLETTIRYYKDEIECINKANKQVINGGTDEEEKPKKEKITLSNSISNDLRFTQNDKVDANSFVETLDDSVIDKIETFVHEVDRLALHIYDIEDLNDIESIKIKMNDIVEVFTNFTGVIDSLATFPVTVRAFISFSNFLDTLDMSFVDDKAKKKMFVFALLGVTNDLEEWIKNIFVDRLTNDIHYFDASFANNCLELEAMFNDTEIESDDDDLEFF